MKLYREGVVGQYRCQLSSSLGDSVKWDCMYDSIYLLLCDRMNTLIGKDYPGLIIDIPRMDGMISYVEDTSRNQIIYSMEFEFVELSSV